MRSVSLAHRGPVLTRWLAILREHRAQARAESPGRMEPQKRRVNLLATRHPCSLSLSLSLGRARLPHREEAGTTKAALGEGAKT